MPAWCWENCDHPRPFLPFNNKLFPEAVINVAWMNHPWGDILNNKIRERVQDILVYFRVTDQIRICTTSGTTARRLFNLLKRLFGCFQSTIYLPTICRTLRYWSCCWATSIAQRTQLEGDVHCQWTTPFRPYVRQELGWPQIYWIFITDASAPSISRENRPTCLMPKFGRGTLKGM